MLVGSRVVAFVTQNFTHHLMLLVPMVPEQTVGGANIVALLAHVLVPLMNHLNMIVEGLGVGPVEAAAITDILHTLVHLFMMNLEAVLELSGVGTLVTNIHVALMINLDVRVDVVFVLEHKVATGLRTGELFTAVPSTHVIL